jgi:YHS domain-containing protein
MTHHTKSANDRTDPVCGMTVEPGPNPILFRFRGNDYLFCAEACRKAFAQDPHKYMLPKRKNFWHRYLDRLNKTTGGKPPACCR